MHLSKLMAGNYPFRTNVPAYDAALLDLGEMLMRHATMHQAAAGYYITAYTSSNAEAEDSIGICQAKSTDLVDHPENAALYGINADGLCDKTASTGFNFMPVIANPHAIYFAFYDQAAAQSCTHAENGTAITITSIEDHLDGGWIYTTDGTDSSATYSGKLRYITADDGTDLTVDSTLQVDTSSDFIKIFPIGSRITGLNAAATGFLTTIAAETGIYLEVIENYGKWRQAPTHNLRYWNDKGLDGLGGKIATFEAEIVQLRHCWHAVVA